MLAQCLRQGLRQSPRCAPLMAQAMSSSTTPPTMASRPINIDRALLSMLRLTRRSLLDTSVRTEKKALVAQLVAAKEATGKTYTQISKEIGLTNAYTAQLFYNQAQLKPGTVDALRKAVPGLTDDHVSIMQRCPMRSFDPSLIQEPQFYRIYEAVMHYGETFKALLNEECGDGIESAIDFFADFQVIEGKAGEKRVCLVLNGKFLPHTEQKTADNTAPKQYGKEA